MRNGGEGIDIMEGRSTGSLEVRDARFFLTLHNLESGKQELAQMRLPIPSHLSTTTHHFRQQLASVDRSLGVPE